MRAHSSFQKLTDVSFIYAIHIKAFTTDIGGGDSRQPAEVNMRSKQ